jgi:hypothetical protein
MPETFQHVKLASRVIAVACIQEDYGEWAVYVMDVPGFHHDEEWQEVARRGDKQSEVVAKAIFPRVAELGYNYRV